MECPSCGSHNIVDDRMGDRTCTGCGLVLEERLIMDDIEYNWSWCHDSHAALPGSWSHEAPPVLDVMLARLQLDSTAVATSAFAIYNQMKEHHQFRGSMLNAVFAACIYMGCLTNNQGRVPRAAHEIYEMFCIDSKQFYKAFKEIQSIVPRITTENRFTEDDGMIRQLEQLASVPINGLHDIARRMTFYNSKRKDMKYMLATPPTTINAVLIALACEDLGIPLNRNEMIKRKWTSEVTLKKHVKMIRGKMRA